MTKISTLAIGVDLHFVSTAEGGRATPLPGGSKPDSRFTYRPNWGLPGWPDGEQSGAPVLGFSAENIQPGEDVRAILVPVFADRVPAWWQLKKGDELRMYEGSRICGRAVVQWIESANWHMSQEDQERVGRWLTR